MKVVFSLVPLSLPDLSDTGLLLALVVAQAKVRASHTALVRAVEWMETVHAALDQRGIRPPAATQKS